MTKSVVAIVDYGMGNMKSVQNAIKHVGGESVVIKKPNQLSDYEKIILPGVGAFGKAMHALNDSGMADALRECYINKNLILGICLGMQLMCSSSEENGFHKGLGWIPAKVKRFPSDLSLPIPHVGWNEVRFTKQNRILEGVNSNCDAYFVHSFYVDCEDKNDVLATTNYGFTFDSIINREHIWGIQFHPEKSQGVGLKMIKNFIG